MPEGQALAHAFQFALDCGIVFARSNSGADTADQLGSYLIIGPNRFAQLSRKRALDGLLLFVAQLISRSNLSRNPTEPFVHRRFELAPDSRYFVGAPVRHDDQKKIVY